ncbi:MAG: hypothetical protein WBG02_15930 [Candidatus Acidiferrum sp.]
MGMAELVRFEAVERGLIGLPRLWKSVEKLKAEAGGGVAHSFEGRKSLEGNSWPPNLRFRG